MARFMVRFVVIAVASLLLVACVEIDGFRRKERSVVAVKHLYVRNAPTTTSLVLKTYHLNDTILTKACDSKWAMVEISDGKIGFIPIDSVSPVDSKEMLVFAFFEKLINWKTWLFWSIALALIVSWLLIERASMQLKDFLKTQKSVSIKGLLVTPVVLFVCGIMSAVLYINWKEMFISSVQAAFEFSPVSLDFVSWVMWVQLLVVLIAVLLDLIGSIFKSGVVWGFFLTLIDIILGAVICIASFFITSSLYIVGIVVLVVFFAREYTNMVSKNSRRLPHYKRPN